MNIETFLETSGASYETHEHPATYSSQQLAAVEHVSGYRVAKPVVVRTDHEDILCVLPACCKIDFARLADAMHSTKCLLAEEAELAELFPDVELGAEPPFGTPYGLRTIVDSRLAEADDIIFNAGSHGRAIRMSYSDYARVAEAEVLDFCTSQ